MNIESIYDGDLHEHHGFHYVCAVHGLRFKSFSSPFS